MYLWSWLFSPYIGAALFVLLAIWLAVHWREMDAIMVLCAGAATGLAIVVIKQVYQRPRPRVDAGVWATDPSFPSGHAAGVTCFALLAWWFLTPKKYRTPAFPIAIVLIALVSGSRLYFGVHYLSDVVAGIILGSVFALSAIAIDRQAKMR